MERHNENDDYFVHDNGTEEMVLTMRPPRYAYHEEREVAEEVDRDDEVV